MKNYKLEVYPRLVYPYGTYGFFGYRLTAKNGTIMLHSGTGQRFNKDGALRAARNFNKAFGGGELEIHLLDSQGNVIRKTR